MSIIGLLYKSLSILFSFINAQHSVVDNLFSKIRLDMSAYSPCLGVIFCFKRTLSNDKCHCLRPMLRVTMTLTAFWFFFEIQSFTVIVSSVSVFVIVLE